MRHERDFRFAAALSMVLLQQRHHLTVHVGGVKNNALS